MRLHDGKFIAEQVKWYWLSEWAKKKGMKPAINAKLEKLLTPYYRSLGFSAEVGGLLLMRRGRDA